MKTKDNEVIVRYDDGTITLDEDVVEALKNYMRAVCAMMQRIDPATARCWEWGDCQVYDFSTISGCGFNYGGSFDISPGDPKPGEFIVRAAKDSEW